MIFIFIFFLKKKKKKVKQKQQHQKNHKFTKEIQFLKIENKTEKKNDVELPSSII